MLKTSMHHLDSPKWPWKICFLIFILQLRKQSLRKLSLKRGKVVVSQCFLTKGDLLPRIHVTKSGDSVSHLRGGSPMLLTACG